MATRGAVLYFVLADLASVDVMYQFSLTWFQGMFVTCINMHPHARPHPGSSKTQASSVHLAGALRPSSARSRSSDSQSSSTMDDDVVK